jgi:uracil-DNA glycosylase
MDAREALRRYLEQRREAGETELTLDTLNVEQALGMLGARPGVNARRTGPAPAERAAAEHVWGQSSVPDTRPDAPAASPGAEAGPTTSDWREAIRAAGGAPDAGKKAPSPPEPSEPMPRRKSSDVVVPTDSPVHVPATQAGATAESPLADVPAGLVVGGVSRAVGDDPAFKLASLEEIAATVAGCRRCPLYATATNPVPGAGNPEADFMIVGEAPGANEDEQGVPFVGQAGQLLTKIIGAINLGREDVFIANVLKHRPPGNRNPLPEEVTACSPYLVRQIELVRPKVILALGTFAAQTLLETKLTIGKLRGQVHRYYGVPLIVTYHPAALLRNPAWKRPTWEDVQLARRILDRPQPAAGA